MKYINYLFISLFTFTVFSTILFAQDESPSLQTMPLPLNIEGHYEYTYTDPINQIGELLFHFQAEEAGALAIAVSGGIKESVVFINLYDEFNQQIQRLTTGLRYGKEGIFVIPYPGTYTIGVQFQTFQAPSQVQLQEQQPPQEENLSASALLAMSIESEESGNELSLPNDVTVNDSQDTTSASPMIRVASAFAPTSAFASFVATDKDDDDTPEKAKILISEEGRYTIEDSVGGLNTDPWDWWKIEEGFNIVLISASTEDGDIKFLFHDPNRVESLWDFQDEVARGIEEFNFNPENRGPVWLKVVPVGVFDPDKEIPYTIEIQAY